MARLTDNAFTRLLDLEYALVQAPMAGGATTPELVAAVSNAGALGSLGAALLTGAEISEDVRRTRALTNRPFNVNLFVASGQPPPTPREIEDALHWLEPFRDELQLDPVEPPATFAPSWTDQFEAVLDARPRVASFTFGILDASAVEALHEVGSVVIGTATTVAEAEAWVRVGADVVCAQGAEAGGHRGTFLEPIERSLIGTMALVPQMADALDVPVIAAGGIMDGRGVAAALMLGANAVQMGTAFLPCPESGIPLTWKKRVLEARDDDTELTRAFTGRYARGFSNAFVERMRPVQDQVPAYPTQSVLVSPIRRAAIALGRWEYVSMWAGQAAGLSRGLPAAELVRVIVDETHAVIAHAATHRAQAL